MRSRAADRRQQEKQIVSLMISIYCRKRHGSRGGLCPKCATLEKYAAERSERCPFMEKKTTLFKLQSTLLFTGNEGKK